MYGKSFDVEVFVTKHDTTFERVFHEKISSGSEICDWIGTAKFEFTLDSGTYILDGSVADDDSGFSFNNKFSVILQSPLKQFKSGVPFDEIRCRDSLVLVTKNDVFPACIKLLTAKKLIQRGWTINEDSESLNKKWCEARGMKYRIISKYQ